MNDLLFVLSLVASSLAIFLVCRIDVRGASTTFFPTYVMVSLFIQFVVCPFAIYFFRIGINPAFPLDRLDSSILLFASLVSSVFFMALLLGMVLGNRRRRGRYLDVSPKARGVLISGVLFIVSIVCFGLFVHFYGGLDYVLSNASKIRSGLDENKNYLGAFFKLFTYYIEFVTFFVYGKYLQRRSIKWLAVFLVLVTLCIAKSGADAGRGSLLNVFVGLLFVSIFLGLRLPLIRGALLVGAGFFVLMYGKTFLFQIYSGAIFSSVSSQATFVDEIQGALVEFSHPFLSSVLAIDQGVLGERWFIDFFIWILKPLRLLGYAIPDSISYYNTYLFSGFWDSDIPPGLVAFAHYEGGIFFVPVFGILMGYLLSRVNRLIQRTMEYASNQKPLAAALCGVLAIYVPFLFTNTDPALFIQWILAYLVLFIALRVLRVIRLPRYSRAAAVNAEQ